MGFRNWFYIYCPLPRVDSRVLFCPKVNDNSQSLNGYHRSAWIRWLLIVLVNISGLFASAAWAQLYWDTNSTTAGAGATPSATWSTSGGTTKKWSTSSAGTVATANWTSGSDAVFSAGTDAINAYTVTVSGTQNVSSITVEEGSPTLATGTINFNDASPDITVASGSTLTFGVAPTSSSTNGLNITNQSGTAKTVFSASTTLTGTVNLGGGTLQLGGTSYTFGTLNLTGNSTIDFAGATTLNLTTLNLNGFTLSITSWIAASDFFYTANWTGATPNVMGSAPMNLVTFNGFTAAQTGWDSFDNQIRPNVPEPATYGVVLIGGMMAFFAWRRRRA